MKISYPSVADHPPGSSDVHTMPGVTFVQQDPPRAVTVECSEESPIYYWRISSPTDYRVHGPNPDDYRRS